ncbi:hypothetical protein F66182_751 [Fusarium sp. NRRL 66182]|nr:hypothetical protein F66182_751 [Fusarium sp. NRRL 66182]
MAPTRDQISALLQQNPLQEHAQGDNPGSLLHFGGLESLFTKDIRISIPALDIDIRGQEALSASNSHSDIPALTDIIDTKRPIETLPPQVIGGGSEDWAVAVLTSKATTVSGKPWNHETVGLIHFTPDGKIDIVKAYIDSKHVVGHIDSHK